MRLWIWLVRCFRANLWIGLAGDCVRVFWFCVGLFGSVFLWVNIVLDALLLVVVGYGCLDWICDWLPLRCW